MFVIDLNLIHTVSFAHIPTLLALTLISKDLSFNKIKKIEGLEALTKLEDFSLCNNEIEMIEGLDSCLALNALSLGNNKIKELDQVGKLRKLPKLNVLNLAGNPLCTLDYKNYSVAYLKHLKYLDYSLITPDQVSLFV